MFNVHILCGVRAVALDMQWSSHLHTVKLKDSQVPFIRACLTFLFLIESLGSLIQQGVLACSAAQELFWGRGLLQAILQIIMGFLCRNVPEGAGTMAL